MDSDIESHVKSCELCQINRSISAEAKLHPWEWPQRPRVRLHVDYAGLFMGKIFLVFIVEHSKWIEAVSTDAHSKWIEAFDTAIRRQQLRLICCVGHLRLMEYLNSWFQTVEVALRVQNFKNS